MANTHSARFIRTVDSYAERADVVNPNSQFTTEFWLRMSALPTVGDAYQVLAKTAYFTGACAFRVEIARGGAYLGVKCMVNSFTFEYSTQIIDILGLVDANEWHHYAITWDIDQPNATEKYLYLDTAPIGYGFVSQFGNVTTGDWANNAGRYSLGYNNVGGAGLFDIDDFRVWNTIRSASQISNNYNRELDPGDADWGDLFSYHKLNNDLLDASGNGRHFSGGPDASFIAEPAFTESNPPESRLLPHATVPRPISGLGAANREFARIQLQEAGTAIPEPANWKNLNILNFRTGFALVEEVGVPGHINIDNTGGATPGPHATTHEDGDTDEITVQNLGSGAAPVNKVLESDGAGGWTLIDTPSSGSGTAATGIYERQVSGAIPEGDATLDEITTGVAAYPGSALALAVKVEDAVTVGTITVTLKVAGGATIVATLNTGVPTKRVVTAAIGAYPIAFENEITIAIETAGGYENAAGATTGITIDITLINGEIGGSTQVSSTTVYGCPVSLAVNDAVYLSGADAVDLADADDANKQPLIGFVRSKPTTTSCEVLYYGELTGFSGLSVGSNYFLSETPGEITTVAPTAPGSIVQKVGFPRNATTLVVFVDRDYVEN